MATTKKPEAKKATTKSVTAAPTEQGAALSSDSAALDSEPDPETELDLDATPDFHPRQVLDGNEYKKYCAERGIPWPEE